MEKAQRRAGLPATGEIHVLRHTFWSHLATQGEPAKAIQERAGHVNLSTTLRYMHLSPPAKDGDGSGRFREPEGWRVAG